MSLIAISVIVCQLNTGFFALNLNTGIFALKLMGIFALKLKGIFALNLMSEKSRIEVESEKVAVLSKNNLLAKL